MARNKYFKDHSGEQDTLENITFDPNGKHEFYDADFTYDEFDLRIAQITGFKILNQTDTNAKLIVEGVFNFKDLFGRGSALYFVSSYTVHKNGITINTSGTAPIAPALPDIETYYVPKSSFEGMDIKTIASFMDLYIHAALNATNMEPTEKERNDKEAYPKLSFFKKLAASATLDKAEEYYILSFCMDRLPPESSLEMRITSKPDIKSKKLFDSG